MSKHVLNLDENDRQLVLHALAVCSLRNPGFDYALNAIAIRIDNVKEDGRGEMYEAFRALRADVDAAPRVRDEADDPVNAQLRREIARLRGDGIPGKVP